MKWEIDQMGVDQSVLSSAESIPGDITRMSLSHRVGSAWRCGPHLWPSASTHSPPALPWAAPWRHRHSDTGTPPSTSGAARRGPSPGRIPGTPPGSAAPAPGRGSGWRAASGQTSSRSRRRRWPWMTPQRLPSALDLNEQRRRWIIQMNLGTTKITFLLYQTSIYKMRFHSIALNIYIA